MRSIHQAIRLSEHRDHVKLEARWAARPADISQALMDTKPTVVHISATGGTMARWYSRRTTEVKGTCPQNDLVGLIRAVGERVRVILFNACFSEIAADAAAEHLDAAIGMDAPVTDVGARAFSEGFYRAVGGGHSVAQAFEVGRFELRNTPTGRGAEAEPVLKTRPSIDPSSVFLVAPSTQRVPGLDGGTIAS